MDNLTIDEAEFSISKAKICEQLYLAWHMGNRGQYEINI